MTASLIDRWLAVLPEAPRDVATRAGEDLLARWSEPHRSYHGTGHLLAVLDTLDELEASRPALLAGWWHDAVCDPTAADNEQRSAELATTSLRALGIDDATCAEVVRLVLLTLSHDAAESDVDGAALCDADLRVLAGPPASYDAYVAAVRTEYSHVDDNGWRAGRSAVLRDLLALPSLFRTATGRAWEAPARANLSRELASLTDGASHVADPPP